MAVMARYPDKYFDLAPVDIPYGIDVGKMAYLKEKGTMIKQRNGTLLNPRKRTSGYKQKDWDKEPPDQAYFDELVRVSKVQIIFGVEYVDWDGLGPGRIRWDKGVAEGMSFNRYEMAYCSAISHTIDVQMLWSGMQQARSLAEPMTAQGNKKLNEKRIHECQKPVMLYERLYLDFGFEGMKIIDTHVGSGSSRIAADKMNCEYVGAEIDDDHWMAQEKRFAEFKSKLRLF